MDIDIQEEVYKCSKCGLCQSVCPVYLATKNEMYLPRGRYIILNNFFNNKKKLSKKFIKNLDLCLNCNVCKNFCPSNIDANEIFTLLKNKYNYTFIPFSLKYSFFLFKHLLNKKTPLIKRKKRLNTESTKEKVVYFQGCVNTYIDSSDKNASLNILDKLGYEVLSINTACCGLPHLSDGNLKAFYKNAQKITKNIPSDCKYIVCSCDSCYQTLKRIEEISNKLITIDELLKINAYTIKVQDNSFYHKPLARKEHCYLPLEIKLINRKGCCSLMENFFMIKHKEASTKILKTVFYKKEEIDNKIIITSSQQDKIGLIENINKISANTKVYSYSEYVHLFTDSQ